MFQRDAHQLTTRSDAGLLKKLLQRCFHRALRNFQSCANLLVAAPFKHSFEDVALTLREVPPGGTRLWLSDRLRQVAETALVDPDLSGGLCFRKMPAHPPLSSSAASDALMPAVTSKIRGWAARFCMRERNCGARCDPKSKSSRTTSMASFSRAAAPCSTEEQHATISKSSSAASR